MLLVAGGIFAFFKYQQSTASSLPQGIVTTPVTRSEISTKVGSTGKARANQMTSLLWQTTGTVGKVYVKNQDKVRVGDVLLELDPASLKPSILQAMEKLPAAQRSLDLLEVSDVKRTQAKEDLAKAQIDFQKAKETRELKNQRNSSDTSLEVAYGTYLQAKSNLNSLEEFYSFLQDKPEDDLTRAQVNAQLSMARKNYNWALWNYQWAQSKPLPEDVLIADTNLRVAESKLADAKREWEKVKDNPDPDDVILTKSNVGALKAQIDQTKIVASIDGTVTDFTQLEGDLVKSGQTALVLLDTSRMFLDISVSEVDINRVKIGKDVIFTFDAISDKTYQGTVTEISKVGKSDQEIINYTVTCEINDFDASIKPGMTAAASIEVDKAENVIIVPNDALRIEGKQYSVYLVRENKIKQIPVELGLISETFSEVKSGDIHEGDILVTNPLSVANPESGK
jgi:HlyD family secretion protein